jgi:hypothetical protein
MCVGGRVRLPQPIRPMAAGRLATAHGPKGTNPLRVCFIVVCLLMCFLDERRGTIARHYAPLISHIASYFRICQKAVWGTFEDSFKRAKLGQSGSTNSRHVASIGRGNCLAGVQPPPSDSVPHRRSINITAADHSPRFADGSLIRSRSNMAVAAYCPPHRRPAAVISSGGGGS